MRREADCVGSIDLHEQNPCQCPETGQPAISTPIKYLKNSPNREGQISTKSSRFDRVEVLLCRFVPRLAVSFRDYLASHTSYLIKKTSRRGARCIGCFHVCYDYQNTGSRGETRSTPCESHPNRVLLHHVACCHFAG
jgi:hypothetical protein